MSVYHNPVLLRESISALIANPDGCYADATFGGGGHAMAAGCTIPCSPEKAVDLLMDVINEVYP